MFRSDLMTRIISQDSKMAESNKNILTMVSNCFEAIDEELDDFAEAIRGKVVSRQASEDEEPTNMVVIDEREFFNHLNAIQHALDHGMRKVVK